MTNCVHVQVAAENCSVDVKQVTDWVCSAKQEAIGEVCVRFVDEDESEELNSKFRRSMGPTNVLAFPAAVPGLLGDLAVCYPVAAREAEEQSKELIDHVAHLVVHGVLHLRGFTHDGYVDAESMERLEAELLATFGIEDPYLIHD